MHNCSLNAIAGHATMYPALSAVDPIPAMRISSHIMRAGTA
jgi:hypothetical protein